jgi:hypothetical protein
VKMSSKELQPSVQCSVCFSHIFGQRIVGSRFFFGLKIDDATNASSNGGKFLCIPSFVIKVDTNTQVCTSTPLASDKVIGFIFGGHIAKTCLFDSPYLSVCNNVRNVKRIFMHSDIGNSYQNVSTYCRQGKGVPLLN